MNNRYICKGKRKDNGEWIEGEIVTNAIGGYYIHRKTNAFTVEKNLWLAKGVQMIEVIPETVGQCTGLEDKNGKLMFEGDIVELYDKNNDIKMKACVEFGNPNKEYNWGYQLVATGETIPNLDILLWVEMEDTGAFIEVIGNIHDNPELLEVER